MDDTRSALSHCLTLARNSVWFVCAHLVSFSWWSSLGILHLIKPWLLQTDKSRDLSLCDFSACDLLCGYKSNVTTNIFISFLLRLR